MSREPLSIRAETPILARFNRKNLALILVILAAIFLLVTLWGARKPKEKSNDQNISAKPFNTIMEGKLSYADILKEKPSVRLPAKKSDPNYEKLLAEIDALKNKLKEKPKPSFKERARTTFRDRKPLPKKETKILPSEKVDPNAEAFRSSIFFPVNRPASNVSVTETFADKVSNSRNLSLPDRSGFPNMTMPDMSKMVGGDVQDFFAQNNQDEKKEFIQNSQSLDKIYLDDTLHEPVSPYEVKEGSLIPCTLITGLNSDLPGKIIAQVRENVYDTVSGNYLLLPQGSRLIGDYDSIISYGQERILVVFSRIIFPNGDSISLQGMPGMDLSGYAGLADEVDEHWFRILSSVVVAALFNATSEEISSDSAYVHQTSEEVAKASSKIISRQLNIQPTITIRPGWDFNVFVKKDMILRPYSS